MAICEEIKDTESQLADKHTVVCGREIITCCAAALTQHFGWEVSLCRNTFGFRRNVPTPQVASLLQRVIR